ncbi:MAG: hydrogenase iron-sulfur subunit [Desulfobacteraceae bacterium]|nr:hydrogenase iron-sulfur subunit [Desulfobacteraceae bacterium]
MDNFKIVLFLCNWSPHAAFQKLQDLSFDIPAEINMIRIPCTGRISKALLFKAFEMGADGVALAGCSPGTCRYGSGTENAIKNTQDTRDILDIMGLGSERMRLETFLPDETDKMYQFLSTFTSDLKTMGKTPIKGFRSDEIPEDPKQSITKIIAEYDAYACLDCGKCTSSCPLALSGKDFSPRALVTSLIEGDITSETIKENIWSCLTCGVCYNRCPSEVNFPELIQKVRAHTTKDITGQNRLTHGGFFQSLMRSMTHSDIQQKRWQTLPKDIKTDPDSKILFHGGCAPYFDIFFRNHHKVENSDILENALKLLNFFDVTPAVLENERCCGHDLLWSGDRNNFLKLAKLNQKILNDSGIDEIITACPECYRTFAHDYPANGIDLNFKVTHLYEFLENEIDKSAVTFDGPEGRFTFQDSCRLNGLDEIKDLPRKLINRFASGNFQEMQDSKDGALCCGNSAWTGCDAYSKALQVKRIHQAKKTKSDFMITACPKCRIHLGCAMEDPFEGGKLKMELTDLTNIIAEHICWE